MPCPVVRAVRASTVLLVVTAFATSAFGLPGKEKLVLSRRTQVGDRISVKERSHTEMTNHWKGEGQGGAGGQEVEDVSREFVQEITSENPLALKREYKLSTRAKGKPRDEKIEPVKTSVHGKVVLMGPEGTSIEGGGEISKEDKDDLGTVEKIVYGLLPPGGREVSVGEDWKVGDELGRAIFGAGFDPGSFKTEGAAKLESVKQQDGKKCAKLALRAVIKVEATEVLPSVELDLKGTGTFYVEEGVFRDCKLDGTYRYEVKKTENGSKTTATSEGTKSYEFKAELLPKAK